MENASKALIIAGAILLAILLISLGILIFNQAQDTVNNSGMSEAEIAAFNNKILKYEGDAQPGSVVKSLVNEIIATNKVQSETSSGRGITVTLTDSKITGVNDKKVVDPSVTAETTATNDIKTSKTYKVEVKYSKGVITQVNLTAN